MTEPSLPQESVFLQALEVPAGADRAAFLDRACGDDRGLRAEVEALLRANACSGDMLDLPENRVAATADEPISECPGTAIGPYKLLQQIGEGGMGTVFMAEQSYPVQRKVALKLIKPGMDSRQVSARFEAERQALALMDHPNIAKVFDAGTTASGRPYFVMELVNGVPITRYCDEHRLTPKERVELFVPVCQAVQHAHHKGIIHRDMKPSNVMVCIYDGKPVPKVIDFGVAKATGSKLSERTLDTEFGAIVGTFEYMSPEQAELDQLDIDTRSDIYSLGVLLYELLTGTTPLERKRLKEVAILELLRLIREQEAPRPSTRLSTTEGLPSIAANRGTEPKKLSGLMRGELDWIVLKALEKDRNRRYETANAFAADVLHYLHDESVQACPPSALYRFRKFARRNKARLLIAAGALVLLLVLAVGVPVSAVLRQERDTAVANQERAMAAEEQTRGVLHELQNAQQEIKFGYHLSQARAYRHSGQVGQRFKSLEELALAARLHPSLELRNEAIACLALPDSRIKQSSTAVGFITLDPTFTYCASSDSKGNISVRRLADDQLLKVLRGPGTHAFWLRFSPNGHFLASMHHRSWKWFVRNVDSGEKVLESPRGRFLDFSPDSRQVAVSLPAGGIGLVNLQSGKEVQRIAAGEHWEACAFDRQGLRLAVATATKPDSIRIYELPSGAVLREIPMGSKRTWPDADNLCWGAEDTLLAAVRDGGVVCVVDLRNGNQQALLTRPGAFLERVAFDPTGDLVATTGWNDNALRVWDARTGKQLLSKVTGTIAPQFSRDGRMIACGAGEKLELLEVATGWAACRGVGIPSWRGQPGTVDFDRTGRILAVHVGHGISLWDCRAHRELAFLEAKDAREALFDPGDGSLLVSSVHGLRRWPIRRTPVAGGAELVIGPPRLVVDPVDVHQISAPAGSGLLALSNYTDGQAIVLSWPGAAKEIARVSHRAVASCALSPSGRWLACGTRWGEGLGSKIYDAKSGNFVWEVPHEGDDGVDAGVAFSPDERWLIICDGCRYRFWQVGSWAPGLVIPGAGPLAFTRDGAIAAISSKANQVTLIEVATGRELASLALGGNMGCVPLRFSPDGARLAVTTNEYPVWIWDLRQVRQQLSTMGLDWDQPVYAPLGDEDDPPITKVTILPDQAQEPMMALTTAGGRNIRAWELVANSSVKAEDTRAAIELAQKAVAEKQEIAAYWNTLGVAHYRAGAWQSAALALEKSLKLGGYEDYDLLFLAMVQWQQGDKKRARESFDRACQWMEQHKRRNEEVLRFREEAVVLLGLNEKSASGKK